MAENRHRIKRGNSRRKAALRRKRRILILGMALVFACIVVGITYAVLYHYVSGFPEDKICDNIYIGECDVSGMSRQEAKAVLVEKQEKDKTLTVSLKVDEKHTVATLEEMGIQYADIDKLTKKAVEYGKTGSVWIRSRQIGRLKKEKKVFACEISLDDEKAKQVITQRAVPLAEHAKDAQIVRKGNAFKITEEQDGQTVDIKAAIQKIEKKLNGEWDHSDFSVKLPLKTEKPSIVKTDLESIQDVLGTFSTDAGGGERWQNLKTGVEHLNGKILMPGEKLSVHDETAPYDAEHGYVEAGSYENGQVVNSYGGGICQVSTTLYNAVLYAELEVIERYPHSMLVAYVDPSRDAAIAGDYLDFVFQNSYETPIYLEGEIDDNNQLRFTIYGKETRDPDRTIEFESETLKTEDYGVVYQENSQAALGSMKYSGSPHTGKVAQLWKIEYKNGKEVKREIVNNSTYEKSDQIIEIGTASNNPAATVLVRNAIATQDLDKINAAINEAANLASGASSSSSSGSSSQASSGEASGGEGQTSDSQ